MATTIALHVHHGDTITTTDGTITVGWIDWYDDGRILLAGLDEHGDYSEHHTRADSVVALA